jgi:hypothetical protein
MREVKKEEEEEENIIIFYYFNAVYSLRFNLKMPLKRYRIHVLFLMLLPVT